MKTIQISNEIKLINGCGAAAIRECESNQFDFAIIDPPYGIGNFIFSDRCSKHAEVNWNNNTPNDCFFESLSKVSKNQIIWGANYFNQFSSNGGALIWDKMNNHPNMSSCEIASLSFQKKVDRIKYEWHGYKVKQKEPKAFHPCQKPYQLYKWLIEKYCTNSDSIIDTHLGSGSIAFAVYLLNKTKGMDLKLTAYEINTDYFNQCIDWLKYKIENHTEGLL